MADPEAEAPSVHSEESDAGVYTHEQLKEDADAEATAFKTSMDMLLGRLAELMSQEFSVDIQPGTPAVDEFNRLSEICDEVRQNRNLTLRLRESFQRTAYDFDAYRKTLPASNPVIRPQISKRWNKYMADFNLDVRRQEALDRADQLGIQLTACRVNLQTLEAQIPLEDVTADEAPDAGATPAAEAVEEGDAATAAVPPKADTGTTDDSKKTEERIPDATGTPPSKDKDTPRRPAAGATTEFGDTTWPFASAAPLHGRSGGTPPPLSSDRAKPPSPRRTGGTPPPSRAGLFGPRKSDIAASSSSTHAASTPLAFNADGTSLLPTKDTGPDFSLYGSNPFYLHSAVKLPIPSNVTYDSATRTPLISQTQLKPLEPPTFSGASAFLLWPRFRDKFIRMVHAPGRYLSDDERLEYLLQALRAEALSRASSYIRGHGDGNYHLVTAALEDEYYRPFQAGKVLRQEFLQLRPKGQAAYSLRHFAEDTIRLVNLLRDYDDDIVRDRFALDSWMEKVPHQTRLEMCR